MFSLNMSCSHSFQSFQSCFGIEYSNLTIEKVLISNSSSYSSTLAYGEMSTIQFKNSVF